MVQTGWPRDLRKRNGMLRLKGNIKEFAGIGVAGIGLLIVALGVFFVVQGWSAKNEVRAAMQDEAVTTAIDGVDVPVLDQRTATNQANLIKSHTLGTSGPYVNLDRNDPVRDTYLKGLTLRNSLHLARMGLDLSELVMGLGALFVAVGGAIATLGAVLAAHLFRVTEPEVETVSASRRTAEAEALT